MLDTYINSADLKHRLEITKQIKSDHISEIYLCRFDESKVILRKDNQLAKSLGLDRAKEVLLLEKVNSVCSSPKIIFKDIQQGVLIWNYIEGEEISRLSFKDKSVLTELAAELKNIHDMPICDLDNTTYFDMINHYKKVILNDDLFIEIDELINHLYTEKTELTFCHNDLTKPNILFKESFSFLDWEYACLNDPYFDIATVISSFNLNEEEISSFLTGYSSTNLNLNRVKDFIRLTKLTEKIWNQAVKTLS